MQAGLSIRRAGAADAGALSLLGGATMLETYAELIDGADIVAHSRRRHSEEFYADWLADNRISIWIAQTACAAPVGYAVLMPATVPNPPRPGDLELQRIYVLSRYHGSGVGYALMELAIEESRRQGAGALVLGMMKRNHRALAFYKRQGFTEIGTRRFQVGSAVFDDFVLELAFDGVGPGAPILVDR